MATANRAAEGTALITGASSGIGLELARLFARDGHDLVLVARGRERLIEVAQGFEREFGIRARPIAADLADPKGPEAVVGEVAETPIAFLVNNAGFGLSGRFAELDTRGQLDIIQVNVTALVHLTRLFVPRMLAVRRGRVLNVASTAAYQGGPYMAVYYASKAFVLSFSEALAIELRGTGVTVTTLCPGPTTTEFQQRAGVEGSRLVRETRVMDARSVAAAGYRAMMAGKKTVIPGFPNWLLAQATRFVSRPLAARIAGHLNEPGRRRKA